MLHVAAGDHWRWGTPLGVQIFANCKHENPFARLRDTKPCGSVVLMVQVVSGSVEERYQGAPHVTFLHPLDR